MESSPNTNSNIIPTEIISDEEMALIEAALASASRSFSPPVPNGILSTASVSSGSDIEDIGTNETLLQRFRRHRALAVTDITSSILERVAVRTRTNEDVWAVKFMNFMTGVNQLLFDGLTRELPVVGFVEGVWMVGVIDEIRMPVMENEKNPILVDTKTRKQATPPSEPQCRNGRLQLMCYKYLWDNVAGTNFPSRQFFDFFSLDPKLVLSEEIREAITTSGFPTETLDDLVKYFQNSCSILPVANDEQLLRYELQGDRSLLGEDQFTFDENWLKGKLQHNLEFWQGKREADYTTKDERWKCNFCKFSLDCPVKFNSIDTTQLQKP